MCDISQAISRAFTAPGTGGLIANFESQETQAENAATTADNALTTAITDATQASLPTADNPSALAANQAQMRKLLAAQGAAWSFGNSPSAAPAVATKVLFGA